VSYQISECLTACMPTSMLRANNDRMLQAQARVLTGELAWSMRTSAGPMPCSARPALRRLSFSDARLPAEESGRTVFGGVATVCKGRTVAAYTMPSVQAEQCPSSCETPAGSKLTNAGGRRRRTNGGRGKALRLRVAAVEARQQRRQPARLCHLNHHRFIIKWM